MHVALHSVCVPGSPNKHVVNAVLMAVVGFFIGGPANLISAAIAADLGEPGVW